MLRDVCEMVNLLRVETSSSSSLLQAVKAIHEMAISIIAKNLILFIKNFWC